jgi:hypothetical protein
MNLMIQMKTKSMNSKSAVNILSCFLHNNRINTIGKSTFNVTFRGKLMKSVKDNFSKKGWQ